MGCVFWASPEPLTPGRFLRHLRVLLRRGLQRALWPDLEGLGDAQRWLAERWLRPVWWMSLAPSAAAAPLSQTINSAGIRYRVKGPQEVVVERREAVQ